MTRNIEAGREAFRSLTPRARIGMDDKTGAGQLTLTWETKAQARAFVTLMRAAFDDDPKMSASLDRLLKDLDA